VTGDDEDKHPICQVAKEKYGCQRIVARVNTREPAALQAPRRPTAVSATDLHPSG